MNYIDQLHWRYATKQFDSSKTIDEATWDQIEKSLVLTPSSFGLQPWKFVVVTSADIKQQLLPKSWGQPQIVDCSHLVVLCARETVTNADIETFLEETIATRGGTRKSLLPCQQLMEGFVSRMEEPEKLAWAKNQVYIALGQLMATAAALNVDACPLEGISPSEYDAILNIDGYKTVVACAMGYRSTEDKYAAQPKVRFSQDALIVHK